jgi:hypothetical protein
MKVIVLTAPQLATVAPLQAAAITAQAAYLAAAKVLANALVPMVGTVSPAQRISLSDDGTAIVVTP